MGGNSGLIPIVVVIFIVIMCHFFTNCFCGQVRYTTDFPHFYNSFRPFCVVAKKDEVTR